MTELERRAMLGDAEAQRECTEKGIESTEWDNQFISKKEMYNTLRNISSIYGASYSVDKQSAVFRCVDALMTMKAITIGRCGGCGAHVDNKCANTGYYKPESGFCNDFSPKED